MSRSFEQIVKDAGSDGEVAERLGVKLHQARDWRIRKSIPPEQWRGFVEAGWATLDELAEAAEARAADRGRDHTEASAA